MTVARDVALAICRVNPDAGQPVGEEEPVSSEERAENLLRGTRQFGPYIEDGDPKGWGGVVFICMEQHGGDDDCGVPLEYWGNGMHHSLEASALLDDHYIEFVNAAVAVVHKL